MSVIGDSLGDIGVADSTGRFRLALTGDLSRTAFVRLVPVPGLADTAWRSLLAGAPLASGRSASMQVDSAGTYRVDFYQGTPLGVGDPVWPVGVSFDAVRPNPSRPGTGAWLGFRVPSGVGISAVVHDIMRRRVARAEVSPVRSGTGIIRWSGLDAQGRRVPAGVYFLGIRLQWPGGRAETAWRRFVILR